MATRKIVPRADNEGGLGTTLKRWASAFINALTANSVTVSDLTASLSVFTGATKELVSKTDANLAALVGNLLFPVGSIFTSINPTNPGTSLGFGTWAAFGAGKVLVGLDAGQTEFDTVEETGGAKTHALSIAELATHKHITTLKYEGTLGAGDENDRAPRMFGGQNESSSFFTENAGSGSAHNNLQPYIVIYMWKRTA